MLDQALKNVSVIGAAGKMGSGISLLLLQEMAINEAQHSGTVGTGSHILNLIDVNEGALIGLKKYLKDQITKYAEKNINTLRACYAKNPLLVSNQEIIQAFITGAFDILSFSSEIAQARHSHIVFEAAIENQKLKTELFSTLRALCGPETIFLTNTSSIPIAVLNETAQLNNRIFGFHFYNPPAIQKLVEVIFLDKAPALHQELSKELGKRLNKILVPSKDIAGFIGNGHFIREAAYACQLIRLMANEHPIHASIYIVNKITQDFLIRPMGIFQLIDYVGIDVVNSIAHVMDTYIPHHAFVDVLITTMIQEGILGGQKADGSQKEGFFQYSKNAPIAVFSLEENKYIPLKDSSFVKECDQWIGDLPHGYIPWKKMQQDGAKEEKLKAYFRSLNSETTFGAAIAQEYLKKSADIAHGLVNDGVANSIKDVAAVLKNGFFHLYAPDDPL